MKPTDSIATRFFPLMEEMNSSNLLVSTQGEAFPSSQEQQPVIPFRWHLSREKYRIIIHTSPFSMLIH